MSSEENELSIALIGMAGRFPGANSAEEFWENLCNGVEAVSFFDDQELAKSGVENRVLRNPNYVKARGIVENIELFDAAFFGMTAREAEVMDPQLRLFLECCWEALEDAACDTLNTQERIGLYAGTGISNYFLNNLASHRRFHLTLDQLHVAVGNERDTLTTLAAYLLNLTGPCVTVQTFCSSSLVAAHLACQSLLNYECDMALAGGVYLEVPQKVGYIYQEGGVASPDGYCRAFDAKAQGTFFGNGSGVVVLKRLSDAVRDMDNIYCVIRSSAVNNDGARRASYTAPGLTGQAQVIVEALEHGNIDPATISYVEAHGTGTNLGDPIEIAALTKAFRIGTQRKGFCAIGSVKPNIGHLDRAAGVASLMKVALAFRHKQLPPSLHYTQPNPKIDFAQSPFYVNTNLTAWETEQLPRRAGVSAFGVGGTNAHMILEEAPELSAMQASLPYQIVVISARTPFALEQATKNLQLYFQKHPELQLAEVAYTLQVGRRAFRHRRVVLCSDMQDAVHGLERGNSYTAIAETENTPVVFLFSGLGDQYSTMAQQLYHFDQTFRYWLDYCAERMSVPLGTDFRSLLYPDVRQESALTLKRARQTQINLRQLLGREEGQSNAYTEALKQTSLAQPVLFAIEYALAQVWKKWGLQPKAMMGYSIGEYVAACLAGVFSLDDALAIVIERARLIQALPSGAMLAVPLSEQEVQPWLSQRISLAAVNGPSMCVLAGPADAIEIIKQQLDKQGIICQRVQTTHAFHSHMLHAMKADFTRFMSAISLRPPSIPFISNVTGNWITGEQTTNPAYWSEHVCRTVRFADGLQTICNETDAVLLEIGPGQTLANLATHYLQQTHALPRTILSSLPYVYEQQPDLAFILQMLGRLWCAGVAINWRALHEDTPHRKISLPTYPFERQKYWIEPVAHKEVDTTHNSNTIEKNSDIIRWFYTPNWQQTSLFGQSQKNTSHDRWLIFCDILQIGMQIATRLQQSGLDTVVCWPGEQFQVVSDTTYVIDLCDQQSYHDLLKHLHKQDWYPTHVLHCGSLHLPEPDVIFPELEYRHLYSLLFLLQALEAWHRRQTLEMLVVTNDVYDISGEELLSTENALLSGLHKTISLEYPWISCRMIDVTLVHQEVGKEAIFLESLLNEIRTNTSDRLVALRRKHRWTQHLQPIQPGQSRKGKTRLRRQGVYLITGGLGGIALEIAAYLARTQQARLVLIGRTALPERSQWAQWITTHPDPADLITSRIQKVLTLEQLGAEVQLFQADVSHLEQMQHAITEAYNKFGAIHGVFHLAGILQDGPLQLKTPEVFERVLSAKVKGASILLQIFKKSNVDFIFLFSSIASLTGNFGQADYCAANAFLDALAHRYHTSVFPVCAINWDVWQEVGLATTAARKDNVFSSLFEQGLMVEEGLKALEYLLQEELLPQVVVATRNPTAIEAFLWQTAQQLSGTAGKTQVAETRHTRPALVTPYIAPEGDIEQKIASIWQEVMGIEPIGVQDDFFALNGHSLLAIYITSRINEAFQVNLTLQHFFEVHTIAGLARLVEELLMMEMEALSEDQAAALLASFSRQETVTAEKTYTLPNQIVIFHQNKAETDQFYEDIFVHEVYTKNGIVLPEHACIFDVGANIGLFTLFILQKYPQAAVYAFEPSPPTFNILCRNTENFGTRVKLMNSGLSDTKREATFTFYPLSSGMSSFYAQPEEEREVLQTIIYNQICHGMKEMQQVLQHEDELLQERLRAEKFVCQLRTLSDVIHEYGIETIDLLKIDAQKSEADILNGIDQADWPKIKQIVMEVHDINGRLMYIEEMLKSHQYSVFVEQDEIYRGSVIYNLYAK
jgi:FkbM family methyltransferase